MHMTDLMYYIPVFSFEIYSKKCIMNAKCKYRCYKRNILQHYWFIPFTGTIEKEFLQWQLNTQGHMGF